MNYLSYFSILVCTLIAFLPFSESSAQSRYYDQWYFGRQVGLDFRAGLNLPELVTSPINAFEGSASICDPRTGELLFYTDGRSVWNRNHVVMSNGTELYSHYSSTQSALIIPQPCSDNIYYIFTADAGPYVKSQLAGINYSVVDMQQGGGLGGVIEKNKTLLGNATEKLVGVRHANGRDFWVIAHELDSDRFFVWEVTSNGVNTEPIITSIGRVHDRNGFGSIGYLKASPSGQYLISIHHDLNRGEIFLFDNRTGIVSQKLDEVPATYAASFSPNSNYLYISGARLYRGTTIKRPRPIVRYTMRSDAPGSIARTATEIPVPSALQWELYYPLQIGPDGAIYTAYNFFGAGKEYIGRIVNPDQSTAAFESNIMRVDGRSRPGLGLPNCIDGYLSSSPNIDLKPHFPPIADAGNDKVLCSERDTELGNQHGEPGLIYQWTPAKGLDNPSSPRPIASPAELTTYILRVTDITTGCEALDTVTIYPANSLIRLRISRDYHASIEEPLEVAVETDPIPSGSGLDELFFELEYDPSLMLVDVKSIERLLAGTLLEDWRVIVGTTSVGYLRLQFIAPPGEELSGSGNLFRFETKLYLGSVLGTELDFSLSLPNECIRFASEAGYARLDTLCGLHLRLVELNANKFRTPVAVPNPSNSQVRIEFEVGLDGSTQLEVFDVAGNYIGRLVDENLVAGSYVVNWDASESGLGIYWLRLQSSGIVKIGKVIVE